MIEKETVYEIETIKVYPNPDQPRKTFDEAYIKELASSIEKYGVISPIVVQKKPFDRYMIIAGERRFRALLALGRKTVPAIIKDIDDKKIDEISLIENVQREALTPLEEARAYKRLMDEYSLTQDGVAESVGKSRSVVANKLRLLSLGKYAMQKLEQGLISEAHARTLITLSTAEQRRFTDKIIKQGWSVRTTEKELKKLRAPKKVQPKPPSELRDLVHRMERVLGTRVTAIGNNNKGRIYVDYFTSDDLDRLVDIINLLQNKK